MVIISLDLLNDSVKPEYHHHHYLTDGHLNFRSFLMLGGVTDVVFEISNLLSSNHSYLALLRIKYKSFRLFSIWVRPDPHIVFV